MLYLSYEQSADVDNPAFVQIMNPLDPLSTDNGDLQNSPLQNCLYPGIGEDLQKATIDELDQAIQLQVIFSCCSVLTVGNVFFFSKSSIKMEML